MPASPIDALPRPLAIAVHDAGAANMIAAWVDAASEPTEQVIAAGPALTIWRARFGDDVAITDSTDALNGFACVLSGTGWASDLEHRARIAAARGGIRSVAVIDHWVNYSMRFEREGVVQLPDEIWVGDGDAARIATEVFPSVAVWQHPNLYLAEQALYAGPVPDDGDVLFLLEPARSDWGKDAPGEFQSLDYFMEQREAAGIPATTTVRVRPHPSDPAGKFDEWVSAHPGTTLDASHDMGSALAQARWVVGMNSAGLVIALAAGRSVFSALPPHAPPCVLPHAAITRLCDI
ncbi:hypothetical protein [uncultured Erythrobacter sp.]|uniref:hypothetical protein n=1 Tax=uncultured Erythrobacter sp. TaxID=263913 RepID=UPI00262532B0|nr:hypothetical protein [uncultured Erythrobacter sp.]